MKIMRILKDTFKNNQRLKWIFWPLWLLTIVALVLWSLYEVGYRFNATVSLPQGVYRIYPGTPTRGELASFCIDGELAVMAYSRGYLQAGACPSGVQPLLKVVAGLPGDSVLQGENGISINGQLWRNSLVKKEDRQGRLIAAAKLPSVIPSGMALLLSDWHDGSFDGRYIGFVPLVNLQRVAPVFTF